MDGLQVCIFRLLFLAADSAVRGKLVLVRHEDFSDMPRECREVDRELKALTLNCLLHDTWSLSTRAHANRVDAVVGTSIQGQMWFSLVSHAGFVGHETTVLLCL